MREYALVFVISAAVTFLVTPLARRFAVRVRAMSEVRDRDVHSIPTPRLGGIAMYAGVVAGMLVASQLPFLSAVARDYGEPRAVLVAGGLICMLVNKRNKRQGDFVAGTVVVHEKTIEKVSTIWNSPNTSATVDPQAIKLSSEELVLIETYLNRRSELDPEVRKKTATQIMALIKNRKGIEPAEGQSAENFLETVARQAHETARYR